MTLVGCQSWHKLLPKHQCFSTFLNINDSKLLKILVIDLAIAEIAEPKTCLNGNKPNIENMRNLHQANTFKRKHKLRLK